MADIDCITASFEIVTPMFLGGANQQASGIRAQSFKGELAFWWRALHFGDYFQVHDDIQSALAALHADEQILFGGPKRQGAFLLSVRETGIKKLPATDHVLLRDGTSEPRSMQPNGNPNKVGPGILYLGYGVIATAPKKQNGVTVKVPAQLERSCLAQGGNFEVTILFRPPPLRAGQTVKSGTKVPDCMDSELRDGLIRALKLMGLIGGLGSRKRRGWGSIAMTRLDGAQWETPSSVSGFKEQLANLIVRRTKSGRNWPLSAFAQETEIRLWDGAGGDENPRATIDGVFSGPMNAFEAVGRAFQIYRGWGRGGQVAGAPRMENFKPDHDWFKSGGANWGIRNGHGPNGANLPERANFGLPHNYFHFREQPNGNKITYRLETAPSGNLDRRGSPLFFHIHRVGQVSFPVAIYFDNAFLPTQELAFSGAEEEKDPAGKNIRRCLHDDPSATFFNNPDVIRDFLNGVDRPTTVNRPNKAPFRATKVFP